MAKYLGNALLLKVESTPNSGDWQTIGASSNHTVTLNNEVVDVSDKDSNRWKELLAAGDRSASISFEGFISDNTYFALVESASKTNSDLNYLLEYGDSKIVNGSFHIDSFEGAGSRSDAQSFSITLTSRGAPAWGKLTDFLLAEDDSNLLDENNQYIQGS